ncbi:MAG: hypothetical protein FJ405_15920, partial [Verrucomicrobia bacterium]|nr:hypothetical protein [Verrucomicrobiota bacterium]
ATKRPDIARQPLRDALLDSHTSMREMARQFLAVADVENVRGFYAAALERGNEKQRFAVICGLGETGTVEDMPLVARFLNSPLTRIRRAAAYAVGRLDLEGQLARLVRVLSDAMPSVSREALKALQRKARYVSLDDLEELVEGGSDFHVRRNALTLISHTDKWKKIPALLKACADKDERIVEQAAKALRAWSYNYNSSFAEPTRDDFQKISGALSQVESCTPHGFAAELRACLQTYFK